ncbi:hypothetical protein DEI96_003225 [Curtobacterium sp. MCLR17_031]|jgi:hypothetical protein|uniref:hypothetical protein n=1 Tax=Curtobacterium sp. MCLR17_031 TaxID=2175622 RepID=UPI000DA9EC30|nr:hypothetical protein [Curtobacterium sp. MCLR17_031]WIE58648.1 hypothetical protein DEI96_003225 [Curtobacterium sp. MCLR17_031]
MSIKNVVLAAVVLGSVVGGGIAVDTVTAPEASAATCWRKVTQSTGFNESGCGRAQHFNRLRSGTMKWGNVVGGNKWSYQAACWTNIAQYGMTRA